MTTTVDVVTADGMAQHWSYTAGYDERDVRITGNDPNGDMAARKRINPLTTVTTIKRMGQGDDGQYRCGVGRR